MRILAIGTSGKNCTVAIFEDGKIVKEINNQEGLTHSQTLMPEAKEIMESTSNTFDTIDAYAVSIGPGSFTGIRIGVSTIKGFCISHPKKVFAVPSLLALAYNVRDFKGYIVSCIDARNDNVYSAIYENLGDYPCQIGDYIADNVTVLIEKINELDNPIVVVGDGANLLKERITKAGIEYADERNSLEYASMIALAGVDLDKEGKATTGTLLSPLYLKKSQAERELEEKNK